MADRRRPPADQLGLFDAPASPPSPPPPPVTPPRAAPAAAPPPAAGAPRDEPSSAPGAAGPEPPERPDAPGDAPLPDRAARDRIRSDLETNLLVEAGAGSGKTTALVDRMVALVSTGAAAPAEVAAVTFTRKAAAELRQRYQAGVEAAVRAARDGADAAATERLDRALREIDRTFIGTIHSFCARLLRERPVEAGLDPAFRELMGAEEIRLRRAFWRAHLERAAAADDPGARALGAVGLAPARLQGLFDELVGNPDVTFPAEAAEPPAAEAVDRIRRHLAELLDRGRAMLPPRQPEKGWDSLQARLRLLLFLREVVDWRDDTTFLDLIGEELHGRSCKVTQNRWPDGAAAKALGEDWLALREDAAAVLDRWWAHRYPIALRFAREAAEAYAAERRRTGRLDFQDLLVLAARLLREHPAAREQLGQRYRRLLVDEFQDTDPIQAEVLMLLASPADERPWEAAVPRPGALFVVGDPKQSIYRFRRADIAVYNLVRDRFREFGDVVELVANFRSVPAIGALVGAVFGAGGRFPSQATTHQAAFAPLATRREPGYPRYPVSAYHLDPAGGSQAAAAADGAARLAPWVAGEIDAGRRAPGDFLVLARRKAELATYARALEAWRVPVQVTGAGVDRAEELEELIALLDALVDPTDSVRVVAVLVGLLFGLDHDQLIAWSLAEDLSEEERADAYRRFDITTARSDDGTAVGAALHALHGWWLLSRSLPADVLVHRIIDESGLVPLAAARELGELRAGSLLFALDAIRAAALEGDTSLAAATDALRAALDADEAEAPLEPVRRGVARVMTLHQAKGLEAPVVVLAFPAGAGEHPVTRHIRRTPEGGAIGWLVVEEQEGRRTRTLARPAGWAEKEAEERRYDSAEQDRLLYVAATRARDQLLLERWPGKEEKSPWAGLHPWIDVHGDTASLPRPDAPAPEPLDAAGADLAAAAAELARERQRRARPTYRVRAATGLAKAAPVDGQERQGADEPARATPGATGSSASEDAPEYRGLSWGIAVHGALDAAGRGATGPALRSACRGLLLEAERPVRDGQPLELDELVALVERVVGSELWRRAEAAERFMTEVPFALHDPTGHFPEAGPHPGDRQVTEVAEGVVEGVVDLAFREQGAWTIVDFKTDVGTDPGFPRRHAAYRRQVELYADAWEELTGEKVRERVLFYTTRPDSPVERW